MRRILSLLTLLAGSVAAHQSLQTSSAAVGTVTVTTLQGSQHWQGAVETFSVSSGGSVQFAAFPGFAIALDNNSASCGLSAGYQLRFTDSIDTLSNSFICLPVPNGSTFFMFDLQRCTVTTTQCTWLPGMQTQMGADQNSPAPGSLMAEIWDISGSGYSASVVPMQTLRSISGTSVSIGTGTSMGNIAYLRWCSGNTPMRTNVTHRAPPFPNANAPQSTCDVSSTDTWEFEGNGNGSQGRYNLSFSPAASFGTTPAPAPGCDLQQTSFSTAFTIQLSAAQCGTNLDNSTLTYTWSNAGGNLDGVTQTPTFVPNANAASPTVTGLIRGGFNVGLHICDSAPTCADYVVRDGVVVTDANHNVQSMGNANIDKLYMPMVQWGFNPYPMFDDRAKAAADFFGALLSTTFLDTWNTADSHGTMSCTNGSNSCTTTQNLESIFCGGGTSGSGVNRLILWNGTGTYRTPYSVSNCTTTTLTISPAYIDGNEAGMSFSTMLEAGSGQGSVSTWIGGSNNANYYDNVAAHCAQYYRSGIDSYLSYCHTLGTRWWSMPWINKGHSTDAGGTYVSLVPRVRAEMGLVTLSLDGTISGFFAAIQPTWEAIDNFNVNRSGCPLGDLRECSAQLGFVALAALYDTGSAQTAALNVLSNAIPTFWTSAQLGSGAFVNQSGGTGSASSNGGTSTVNVTNGSTSVVGVGGTGWSSFTNNYFVTAAPGVIPGGPKCDGTDDYDTVAYYQPTVNNSASLTLPSNYIGLTATGRTWQENNIVGCGTQPFMMGYNMHDMYLVYLALAGHDATNQTRTKTIILNDAVWLANVGVRGLSQAPAPVGIDFKSAYYAIGFVESEPNPWADVNNYDPTALCITNNTIDCNIQGSRFLGAEMMSGLAYATMLGASSTVGNTLFAGMWGGLGGTNADQFYMWGPFSRPGSDAGSDIFGGGGKAKDNGFAFGWGNGALWFAVAGPAGSVRGAGVGSSSTIRN